MKHHVIAIAVFVFTFVVFILSPVHQVTDSHYSMLLSESIYRYRSFKLDRFFNLPLDHSIYPGVGGTGRPVHIEKIKDHLFYYYPPGSSILSIPYVAILNYFGFSAVSPDLKYNVEGEKRIEISLAALLMGLLCSIIFCTSNLQLPVNLSLLITAIAAFGTQIWSTASRALWGHTWLILLMGIALHHLLSSESQKKPLRPILLASLLGWMFFVRPTSVVFILCVSILCLIKMQPKAVVLYVLTGIIWLISFVGFSYYHYGKPLPSYYVHRLSLTTFWTGLSGTLFSPSRGLFIFVPVTLIVIYILLRYWKEIQFRGLSIAGGFFNLWSSPGSFGFSTLVGRSFFRTKILHRYYPLMDFARHSKHESHHRSEQGES